MPLEISFGEFVVEALTVSNTKNEKRRGHKNTDVQPDVLEVPMRPHGGSRVGEVVRLGV